MRSVNVAPLILTILMLCLSPFAFALNLSGKIYGGPSPLEGATVTLLNSNQEEVGTQVSDINGDYLFQSLVAGDYYILVTPPAESPFAPNHPEKTTLTDSDLIHNVVLVQSALKLSGHLRDLAGNPIGKAKLYVFEQQSNDVPLSVITVDDAGYYEIALAAGTYKFKAEIRGYTSSQYQGAPHYAHFNYLASNTVLDQDETLDITVPLVILTGQTIDPDGNPVSGVEIETNLYTTDNSVTPPLFIYLLHRNKSVVSDANGRYTMALFPDDDYLLTLTPPESRTDLGITTIHQFAVAPEPSETNLVVKNKNVLSGYVRDASGRPIDNAQIQIYDQASQKIIIYNLFSDSEGYYEVNIGPGTYRFLVRLDGNQGGEYPKPYHAIEYYLAPDTEINSDLTLDLNTSLVLVSGRTLDSEGNPLADVEITTKRSYISQFNGSVSTKSYIYHGYNYTRSDANGNYQMALFPDDDYTLGLIPPDSRDDLGVTVISEFPIAVETSDVDLVVQDGYRVNGYVRDLAGNPIHGAKISVFDQDSGTDLFFFLNSDINGYYEMMLAPGAFKFGLQLSSYNSNYQGAPYHSVFKFAAENTEITGDLNQDLENPLVRVSGRTVDGNGVPVPSVKISTKMNYYNNQLTPAQHLFVSHEHKPVASDANGRYIMALYPYDNYTLTIEPPAGSGFAATPINGFSISEDITQTIVLALPDTTLPVIIGTPIITHITKTSAVVEWQTNEPASSNVIGDVSGSRAGYFTAHAVTLTNLTPSTTYTVSAVSTDKANNGPVTSEPVSFTTLSDDDVTKPFIIAGPIVEGITDVSAVVVWKTNEVASGTVDYGIEQLSNSISQVEPSAQHTITLTGLTPDTVYDFRVSSTDLAGNGPVTSAILQFKTKPIPDTRPPIIIRGPLFSSITQTSLIVSWETDEPATSGVSYNDGVNFNVLTDDTLVTKHQVLVTGLTPDTLYHFTVSSRDAVGNGPTLKGPESVRTLKAPSTRPPVFIEHPKACTVNHQLVRLCWRTDKATNALVEYGTELDDLDEEEAKGQYITNHSFPITGLEAKTVYYFRVTATDTEGNKVVSEIFSVKTTRTGNKKHAKFTKDPVVGYKCNNKVIIEWQTDQPTDGTVFCNSSTEQIQASTFHKPGKQRAMLTNLEENTFYECYVSATNRDGLVTTATVGDQ